MVVRVNAATARRIAVAWAVAVAGDREALFLDTETTGLGGGAEVVDVAVVGSDGSLLLDTLVRPRRPIPPDASAIHGILDRDVRSAPTWPEVFPILARLLEGRRVVVYNAGFDRRMVEGCCGQHRLPVPEARWECAMQRYAEFHGEPGWRGGFRPHKLERAVRAFGAAPGGHRAAGDALACRAVVLGMAAEVLAGAARP